MSNVDPGGKIIKKFEVVAVMAVELLLLVAVALSILVLFVLFIHGIRTKMGAIHTVVQMQEDLQRIFAGVLLVLLGLELIETLQNYFAERHVRVEVILIVAMIAIGRHIVQLDIVSVSGSTLLGVAALILALAVSYFLVERTRIESGAATDETEE